MKAELQGPGPHDGAVIELPNNCVAVVTIAEMPDGQYFATLAVKDDTADLGRVAYCLAGLIERSGDA